MNRQNLDRLARLFIVACGIFVANFAGQLGLRYGGEINPPLMNYVLGIIIAAIAIFLAAIIGVIVLAILWRTIRWIWDGE